MHGCMVAMLNSLSGFIKIARGVGIIAIVVIYTLLVHHVNSSFESGTSQTNLLGVVVETQSIGAILALIPLFFIALTLAFKIRSRLIGSIFLLGYFALAWFIWPLIKQNTGLIFWMLDIGLMLALLMTFAQTLIKGRKPLCVHFAEIINGGTLPPEHEIYARNVTVAWVLFFAMIIIVSTLLFFLAPLQVWSFFVNFLTLPLVALMFAIEFFVRKRLLTNLPESNVMDAVHAYLDKSARTP